MLKNKKKKFLLLKIIVGAIILTPTFSNSSYAEEKVFSFDVNVAKAESNVNSNDMKKELPLVTEEAKKQAENNKTTSAPIQQSSNVVQSAPVVSAITPTEPSTSTGKIVSDTKYENNKSVSNKKEREFLEFTTSNGKKLYLIIDRSDVGKEVKLVTEVSPQDLASMIDTTKITKQQETKEVSPPVTTKQVKSEESSGVSIFVYIFGIGLISSIGFIIFAGFKKRQRKGQEELEEDTNEDYRR